MHTFIEMDYLVTGNGDGFSYKRNALNHLVTF